MGVNSTTFEVNPFLVDVIRAKLDKYDLAGLQDDFDNVTAISDTSEAAPLPDGAPETLIESDAQERFVFHRGAGQHILRLRDAIEELDDETNRRLLRVLLGGSLVELSNVTISGKGRRYRRGWESREDPGAKGVVDTFTRRFEQAKSDIQAFEDRPRPRSEVREVDVRTLQGQFPCDLVVCSPPYPNSFDYTDVYNLELWMLGHLSSSEDNHSLRRATLASHVQISRDFAPPPQGSETLAGTLETLNGRRDALWNRWIPDMIGAYFSELTCTFTHIRHQMRDGGELWLMVGDSQYKGVPIKAGNILQELLTTDGWETAGPRESRTMRTSAQQGGGWELQETLLRFTPS